MAGGVGAPTSRVHTQVHTYSNVGMRGKDVYCTILNYGSNNGQKSCFGLNMAMFTEDV